MFFLYLLYTIQARNEIFFSEGETYDASENSTKQLHIFDEAEAGQEKEKSF